MTSSNMLSVEMVIQCTLFVISQPESSRQDKLMSGPLQAELTFTKTMSSIIIIQITFYIALIPAWRIDVLHKKYTKCILLNINVNYINLYVNKKKLNMAFKLYSTKTW